jgi:hypothetical protein
MEGSVSGSVANAAQELNNAANAFLDEAQSVANAGVDIAQAVEQGAVGTAIAACEAALAGLKHLVAHV